MRVLILAWGFGGRKVYLGGYSEEEHAARTYDRAAIKFWGRTAVLNFQLEDYAPEIDMIEVTPLAGLLCLTLAFPIIPT